MGYINQIPLCNGSIWVEDMVDSINKSLDLLGRVGDGTTFGRWTHDFCDLTNDSLDFMGNIKQISLGYGSIWVEDMVDSINKSLDLLGKVGDGTTFGCGCKKMTDFANDSLNFVGNINQISLCNGSIWVEDMVDSINKSLDLLGKVGDGTTFGC